MKDHIALLSLLGGLALMLHGMRSFSEGLQMALGGKLKMLLRKPNGNSSRGFYIGAFFTALSQFSGITVITLMGLVNAGIYNSVNAIPVVLGANVGTAVTAQIIAFNVGIYSLPLIAIGFIFLMTSKKDSWISFGQILMGLGILYLGMHLISNEAKFLVKEPGVVSFFKKLGEIPILGILMGVFMTAIFQSSTATTGLIIALCMAPQEIFTLSSAIAMVLGANLMTGVTVAFSARNSPMEARRVALANIIIKLASVVVAAFFVSQLAALMKMPTSYLPRQVANAHLFFNLIQALVFLPLVGMTAGLCRKIIPGEDVKPESKVKYLDCLTLESPAVALGLAEKETIRMCCITQSMIHSAKEALLEKSEKDIALVKEKEMVVDELDDAIEVFLGNITKSALSEKQRSYLAILNHSISDIERIADHAHNIVELAELRMNRGIQFSEVAFEEVTKVFEKADESMTYTMEIIRERNDVIIGSIMHLEKEVDRLVATYENNHMDRLEEGACSPEAGPIYLDILRNLERITDHTHNIAYARKFGF